MQVWDVAAGGAAPAPLAWAPAAGPLPLGGRSLPVALRGEPTAAGCRFTPREPGWLETARALRGADSGGPAAASAPAGGGGSAGTLTGTVYAVELPEDLAPGTLLSLQYLDRYGDLWLDVPAVPDVEVVPPPQAGGEAPRPCLRAATRWVQGEDLLCVCGTFPSPAAWSALLVGGRPAGTPVSASAAVVWLRLPAGGRLGGYAVTGRPDAGYAPACAAETQLIAIRGEIDSQRLLRGDSTPMRLAIDGTGDRIPLKVRNLTPAIIAIEGGVEQMSETSGGTDNVLVREVRALARGDFNVEWTLTTPPCPCG